MKQDVSAAAAAAFAVPEKPKDYVAMQLEAIWEAVRANLDQRQQTYVYMKCNLCSTGTYNSSSNMP